MISNKNQRNGSIRTQLFWVANLFLLLGILSYLFLYPDKFKVISIFDFELFTVKKIDFQNTLLLSFVYSFTSFCHVVFMTLYGALLSKKITTQIVIKWAILWGVVDSIFEYGQYSFTFKEEGFIGSYFLSGVFDKTDLVAIWVGVILTSSLWIYTLKNEITK